MRSSHLCQQFTPPSVEAPSAVSVKHADSPGLHLICMRQAQLEQCSALDQQFSGSPGPQPISGQYKPSLSLIEGSNKAASLQHTAQPGNCCFRKHRPLQSRNIVQGHAPWLILFFIISNKTRRVVSCFLPPPGTSS